MQPRNRHVCKWSRSQSIKKLAKNDVLEDNRPKKYTSLYSVDSIYKYHNIKVVKF